MSVVQHRRRTTGFPWPGRALPLQALDDLLHLFQLLSLQKVITLIEGTRSREPSLSKGGFAAARSRRPAILPGPIAYEMQAMTNSNWTTRGKTIAGLIKELQSFEDHSLEVRISIDGGASSVPISLVGKTLHRGRTCEEEPTWFQRGE